MVSFKLPLKREMSVYRVIISLPFLFWSASSLNIGSVGKCWSCLLQMMCFSSPWDLGHEGGGEALLLALVFGCPHSQSEDYGLASGLELVLGDWSNSIAWCDVGSHL